MLLSMVSDPVLQNPFVNESGQYMRDVQKTETNLRLVPCVQTNWTNCENVFFAL